MKKLILILSILLFPSIANAKCEKSDIEETGKIYRCDNKEAVCYVMVEKHLVNLSPMPISCFKK